MARFGLEIIEDPQLLAAAKAEFAEKTGGQPYQCPIPAQVKVPQ